MNPVTELLPLTHGDAELLRLALSKLRPTLGRRHEALNALLKRLDRGLVGGVELDTLQRLLENEYTIRDLVIRQHSPEPDPDPDAPALEALESLLAKLGGQGSFNS